jgi:hypothetical protein
MSHFEMRPIKRLIPVFIIFCVCLAVQGHDVITTQITWNREISRIVNTRCLTCHRQGGTAFSLTSYQEARPWAKAIEQDVLERRMPPWGAVKGFGDFRNDQALTQEQLELIANWAEGGAPEGDPNDLPPRPSAQLLPPITHRAGEIVASGDYRISRPFMLDGFWPQSVSEAASAQVTVELPDGTFKPLVWLLDYKARFEHPFLLRMPLALPAGSVVHGLPPGASLVLLPAIPTTSPEHQNAQYSGTGATRRGKS